ncbi:acylphosphatase [Terrimonas alba]|uniref:acylphosphatase n=1 Tax=Terrimonas alba TaxID=3349636 RepID=UPI0035F341B7
MLQSVSIIVEGLVQGVFYRQTTKAKAIETGITGMVKNKRDGSVQIIATGTEAQLEQLIQWCNQGPERAIVTGVKVEKIPLQRFKDFDIVRGEPR